MKFWIIKLLWYWKGFKVKVTSNVCCKLRSVLVNKMKCFQHWHTNYWFENISVRELLSNTDIYTSRRVPLVTVTPVSQNNWLTGERCWKPRNLAQAVCTSCQLSAQAVSKTSGSLLQRTDSYNYQRIQNRIRSIWTKNQEISPSKINHLKNRKNNSTNYTTLDPDLLLDVWNSPI